MKSDSHSYRARFFLFGALSALFVSVPLLIWARSFVRPELPAPFPTVVKPNIPKNDHITINRIAQRKMPAVLFSSVDPQRWKSQLYQNAYREKEHMRFQGLFRDFFAENNCSEQVRGKILDLLVAQATLMPDTQYNNDSKNKNPQSLDSSVAAISNEMIAALGNNTYNKLLQYEQSVPSRVEANSFALMVGEESIPSTSLATLARVTQEERAKLDLSANSPFGQMEPSPQIVKKYLSDLHDADTRIERAMVGVMGTEQISALVQLHTSLRAVADIQWSLHFNRATSAPVN